MANYVHVIPPHVITAARTFSGQATAPAAGAVVLDLGVLPAGEWLIRCLTGYSGTLTATEAAGNLVLWSAGAAAANLYTFPGGGAPGVWQDFIVVCDGVAHTEILATNAGGASAIYSAHAEAYQLQSA